MGLCAVKSLRFQGLLDDTLMVILSSKQARDRLWQAGARPKDFDADGWKRRTAREEVAAVAEPPWISFAGRWQIRAGNEEMWWLTFNAPQVLSLTVLWVALP